MKIISQSHVLRYLNEGLRNSRLSPSLLFIGQDGIGKKTISKELAKSIGCTSPRAKTGKDEMVCCDTCDTCTRIQGNLHPDLLIINKPYQATLLREKAESQTGIKIECIRHLDKFSQLKSYEMGKRVIIIEDAHLLTIEAANALLKILEEPPQNTQLILLARDERNLPSTIISRCAIIRFRPISATILSQWLQQTHGLEKAHAEEVAFRSQGSLTQALLLKDQVLEMVDLSSYSCDEFFELLSEAAWRKQGRQRAEELLAHLILVAQKKLNEGDFRQTEQMETINAAKRQIQRNVSPRLVLENLYMKLEKPLTL